MSYTPNPSDPSSPADSDYAKFQAAELRALKAYIASLAGLSPAVPFGRSNSPYRNRIINGDMYIDQRNGGAAQVITAGAALAYTVDRMFVACIGANIISQQVASGAFSRLRLTGAPSNTGFTFGQRMEAENTKDMAGAPATLSILASSTSLTTLTWAAYHANTTDTFGTLAAPTKTLIATGAFNINTVEALYSANINIPAAATTGLEVLITGGALLTAQTVTLGEFQLESGTYETAAVAFERLDIEQRNTRCARYTVRNVNSVGLGPGALGFSYNSAGSNSTYYTVLPTKLRIAAPTVTRIGVWTAANCNQPTLAIFGNVLQAAVTVTALGTFISNNAAVGAGYIVDAEMYT